MKNTLILLILFSSSSNSKNILDQAINYFDDIIQTSLDFRYQNALIKKSADLNFYSSIKEPSFPLNILDEKNKQKFIDSLTFNEKGLTSFDYSVFENLNSNETYKVLSLFGAGYITDQIKENESEFLKSGGNASKDYKNYRCETRATCVSSNNRICMSSC